MRIAMFFVLVLLVPVARAQDAPGFHGSEAYREFRLAGYEHLAERMTDLDGDELLDAVVVERSADGIGLSAWKSQADGTFRRIFRSEAEPAHVVTGFKRVAFGDRDIVFRLDVVEESPDEADHISSVFLAEKGGLRRVLRVPYRITHPEEEAGRAPPRIVDLGGLREGFELLGRPGKWPRAVVRKDPKKLVLTDRQRRRAWFVIGIRELVYEPKERTYVPGEPRYVSFLPRVPAGSATATSTLPSSEDTWQASGAVDGKLASSWVEGHADAGAGESITASLEKQASVRMVRVVPGCAESEEAWNARSRVRAFRLTFEDGTSVGVRRGLGAELDPQVDAAEDFALPGRAFGTQTLVFLTRSVRTGWVKLTIEEAEPGGEGTETCISEISAHEALADRK